MQAISAYAAKAGCSEARLAATAAQQFIGTPWDKCYRTVFAPGCTLDSTCLLLDKNSVCIREESRCTIPCQTDSDCFIGVCKDVLTYGGTCVEVGNPLPLDSDERKEAFYNCTMANLDPYLAITVETLVAQQSATQVPLFKEFSNLITQSSCVTEENVAWIRSLTSQQACEASMGACTLRNCVIGEGGIGGGKNSLACTEKICLDYVSGDHYCGVKLTDYSSYVVGNPNMCQINVEETDLPDRGYNYNETFCYALGGTKFSGFDVIGNRHYGACRNDAMSEATCYLDFCIGQQYQGEECHSYCQDTTLSSSTCVGITPGNSSRTFYNWIGRATGTPMGACVLASPYSQCESDGGVWVSGRTFLPGLLDTEEKCGDHMCWSPTAGPLYDITTEEECYAKSCTACSDPESTEPECTSEAACELAFSCSVTVGCGLFRNINEIVDFKQDALGLHMFASRQVYLRIFVGE